MRPGRDRAPASSRSGTTPATGSTDVTTLAAVPTTELDEALLELSALDPQQGRIVELRAFGGLTVEETAEVLGISSATVKRHWAFAQAWLRSRLAARG